MMLDTAAQHRSVWLPEKPHTNYACLKDSAAVDVAIIGAGITGLTTAHTLQRAGLSVAVLEADRVGYGVTGHSTAKLTALHRLVYAELEHNFGRDVSSAYAAANQAGIEQVASLVTELAIECEFERQAAYTFTRSEEHVEAIRREAEAAGRASLPANFVTDTALPFDVKGAVVVEGQAQFNPYLYCVHLARDVVKKGGHLFEMTRVTNVKDADDKDDWCTVETNYGNVHAKHVVFAMLLPFLGRGGFFARTHPSRSYGIAVRLDAPAPTGMHISAESPVRSVRPLADRRSIIVVGEGHKVGQDSDTNRRYEALEAWAREWFRVSSISHRWSSQDFISVDGLPFIGRLSQPPGQLLVVTGLSKWGLAIGTASAAILTDIIQGRDNPWTAIFDPLRINLVASAKELVTENLNVAKHFVGDRLSSLVTKDIQELVVGEGAIVKHQGKPVAAYRDEEGQIHKCSPACTHMGCYVQWNTAEKSWDCPCHGSRFSIDGRVLQGPAVEPLAGAAD